MAENVTRIQIETREGAGRLASETSRSEGVSKPGGQASEQAQRPPGIITSPESAKQSQLLQEASSQQSATLAKIESFLSSSSREGSREGQFGSGPFPSVSDQPKLILPGDVSDSVAASFDPETGIGKVIDVQENVLENLSALPKELSEAIVNLPQTGEVTSEDLQDLANSIAEKSLAATSFTAPELTSPWMADAETGDPGFIVPKDPEKDSEIKRTFESIFEQLKEDKKLISDLTEGLIEIIENPEFEEFNRLQGKLKNILSEFGTGSSEMGDFFESEEGERLGELQIKQRKGGIPELLHVSKPVDVREEALSVFSEAVLGKPREGATKKSRQELITSFGLEKEESTDKSVSKPEPDQGPGLADDLMSVLKDNILSGKKGAFSPTKILQDMSKLQSGRAAKAAKAAASGGAKAVTGTAAKVAAPAGAKGIGSMVSGLGSLAGPVGLAGGLVAGALLEPVFKAVADLVKLPIEIGKAVVEAGSSQVQYSGMLDIGTAQALAMEEVSEFRIRMRRADAIGPQMEEFVEARTDLSQTRGQILDIAMKPVVAMGTEILEVLNIVAKEILQIFELMKPLIDFSVDKIIPEMGGTIFTMMKTGAFGPGVQAVAVGFDSWGVVKKIFGIQLDVQNSAKEGQWNDQVRDFFAVDNMDDLSHLPGTRPPVLGRTTPGIPSAAF